MDQFQREGGEEGRTRQKGEVFVVAVARKTR